CHTRTPRRGDITFFNRSHYEDVLVVRVLGLKPKPIWKKRFDHINAWERMLADEGTRVVKIYLHISKDEQRRRLQERLAVAGERGKFDAQDVEMRKKWDDFMAAYEEVFARTSTAEAPWWIVPANRKWFRDVAVTRLLVETLEEMAPKYPAIEV